VVGVAQDLKVAQLLVTTNNNRPGVAGVAGLISALGNLIVEKLSLRGLAVSPVSPVSPGESRLCWKPFTSLVILGHSCSGPRTR
jgi:hypothetical protein